MDEANVPTFAQPEPSADFEALLWDLFLRLMDVPGDRVEGEILDAQRRLCRALDLDRSALWQVYPDNPASLLLTHEYDVEHDTTDAIGPDGNVDSGDVASSALRRRRDNKVRRRAAYFPWIAKRVLAGETRRPLHMDDLPPETLNAATFRRFGTLSTVIISLSANGRTLGCLSFGAARRPPALGGPPRRAVRAGQADLREGPRTREDGGAAQKRAERPPAAPRPLQRDNVPLRDEIRARRHPSQIVGTSVAIRRTLDLVAQVAPTGATVLLLGETGTGKERLAAAIHEVSPRRSRAMVKVNCAAIPATLIESELFGREKGTYTGALTTQIGRFELANGSTLFLDEIGDLPLETQTKLLRVIENREFERLGSPRPVHVDVRIVAATNRDLNPAIREGASAKTSSSG